MDEYSCPDHGCFEYAHTYEPTPVLDHYVESYNVCTTDAIAIMLRQQREADERRILEDEPGQTWVGEAPPLANYPTHQRYESASDARSPGSRGRRPQVLPVAQRAS